MNIFCPNSITEVVTQDDLLKATADHKTEPWSDARGEHAISIRNNYARFANEICGIFEKNIGTCDPDTERFAITLLVIGLMDEAIHKKSEGVM